MGKKNNTKNSSKNKTTVDKHSQEDVVNDGAGTSQSQDMSISQKLDVLMNAVQEMGSKMKEQDEMLKRQEEKTSISDLSAVPSAHSSPKAMHSNVQKIPSLDEVKTDMRVQAEVEKRMQQYQNASHTDYSGRPTSTLKLGRYRAGVTKFKVPINWPQDLCTVPSGSKQPLYNDMSNEQWVQGMLLCILEESSVENKDYMLLYFSMLMQDAIELSLGTARKAHAVVLQEMEKGRFTWNDTNLVEKCKNRHTQRMLQTVKSTTTSNTQVCVFYNKGKCKNDSDHVSSGILYQHCCSYCYKETKKRYEHPVNQCMRMRNGDSKTETGTVKADKQRV